LEYGIPVIQPEKLSEPGSLEQLRAWSPDVIVVAAFGQILRQEVLDLPSYGCINVHASLLPRWRGAAPINAAILRGDKKTGITIMKMDKGVDTGPILSQRSLRIKPGETAGSLFDRLSALGANLLLDTLPGYLAGVIEPHPQPEAGATYAPMLNKEEGQLDFSHPAEELERKVRAFNPWPGAYLIWNGNMLKVHSASIGFGNLEKGERGVYMGLPAVGTSEDLLVLVEVQPSGRRPMEGKAFLAGARGWKKD
jgi:methionyl-tRNA formyltransferase